MHGSRIPGTSIDYPILQSQTDNTYYLNHALDGSEQPEGAIFTENYNTRTFEDPNTVIYGHDMKNGSMLQNSHNYENTGNFLIQTGCEDFILRIGFYITKFFGISLRRQTFASEFSF